MTEIDRRARIVAERVEKTGIDEVMIERLVRTFYARIQTHDVLGPILNARIDDWELHMQRLCAFWSSVMLATGAYSGSPTRKHLNLPIDGRHFDLWLRLFFDTLRDVCPPAAAEQFAERAFRIAQSLEMAIAVENNVMLPNGERLRRPDADVFFPADKTAV